MRLTRPYTGRSDPLSPRGAWAFLALTGLWIVAWLLPREVLEPVRPVAAPCGYLALACFLVPYLHIARRACVTRPGRMSTWLRWHVACSYAAFFFLLLHTQGRAGSWLTTGLQVLTWLVMLSGVAGLHGQKLLYKNLPRLSGAGHEYGRERYESQRELLRAQGRHYLGENILKNVDQIAKNNFKQWMDDINLDASKDVPENIKLKMEGWVNTYLTPEFQLMRPLDEAAHRAEYDHALLYVEDKPRKIVEAVWQLVVDRVRLDREYRWHLIGRSWLLVHGPAAWALLALVVDHVQLSLRYAGWWY